MWVKPPTKAVSLSWNKPPQAVRPGAPRAAPSMLHFIQNQGGDSHKTGMTEGARFNFLELPNSLKLPNVLMFHFLMNFKLNSGSQNQLVR